ncbi:glycoside hydrolase family 15 protein [Anaeromyxobacter paludicola]|uniref:Glycosyl hydrolase n=1 Tax=Anaeromyxobacter paludicola TaxID=2918171 RepID=A0ABM7X966_9BACT|nr:glycoside hydrolase family 15 protein [Anaeromyxobacter paludicola]BDG08396.1 glycosyl hydrolase [Anaeromyxobacter paludicola]
MRARQPIEDHALIGDCRSAALLTRDGEVDWLCWPRFDSAPVLGSLLDPSAGGWRLAPVGRTHTSWRYLPGTNVVETTHRVPGAGSLRVSDCLTVASEGEKRRELLPEHELLRIATCEAGEVEVETSIDLRPDLGRAPGRWRDAGALGLRFESGSGLFALRSDRPLAPGAGGARGRFRLRAGETARFSLVYAGDGPAVLSPLGAAADAALLRTERFWRGWSARARYAGPFREAVVRSALALKLLAYAPSGAIIAAPTTSLPERPGGDLNWDYRYCWLRDASFTARALYGLGYQDEAESFVSWLIHTTRLTRPRLRILYDVFGRDPPPERDRPELGGYGGARPVRIGNAARDQLQLDVYGEVVDAACQFVSAGGGLDPDTARMLIGFGRYVCEAWRRPDEGIWEPRGGRTQNTYSKVLCWAALDRLLHMDLRGHLPRAPRDQFCATREAIRAHVEARGWSPALSSYTARLGGGGLDAALLLLPWYGYCPAGAPRMRATWRRISRELSAGGALLYRYPESIDAGEGAFGICSFWGAEYLALGGGTLEEAELRLERLLGHASELGLFAEEVDPGTFAGLGNFPQAFTHVGLVNAALSLENRRERRPQLRHQRAVPHARARPGGAPEARL